MKKGLLALAAGLFLTAGSAQAGWYISGGFQNWAHCNANYELKETTSGVFVLNLAQAPIKTISGEFLIVSGSAGNPDWNNKVGTNGSKVEPDVVYNYVKGGGNFTMNGSVENAVITLDTNAGTLLIAGEAKENDYDVVYLIGDFGSGWSETNTNYPLTLKAGTDNVWVGEYDLTAATSYFKMKAGANVYGTGGGDIAVVSGTEYTSSMSGNAYSLKAGKYEFQFVLDKNAETGVLTVTGEGDDPNPPVGDYTGWYMNVQGDFNGWNPSGVAFNADGTVEVKNLAIGTGEFELKVWNGSEDLYYGDQSNPVVLGETTTVYLGGGHMTIEGATADGVYDLTFNAVDNTMVVTSVGGIDYTTWYVNVLGTFNDWQDNGVACNAEGVAKLEKLAIGTKEFKVKVWNGADDWHSNGAAIATNEWVSIPGNTDANMTIAGATADSVYDVEFNCATNEIKVTLNSNVGVEAIEAANGEAVYFNLQGVRVANPENGLFIRVQNGKAVKVVK